MQHAGIDHPPCQCNQRLLRQAKSGYKQDAHLPSGERLTLRLRWSLQLDFVHS